MLLITHAIKSTVAKSDDLALLGNTNWLPVLNTKQHKYTESKKQATILARTFVKCWPIFKILSLVDSLVNLHVATLPCETLVSEN